MSKEVLVKYHLNTLRVSFDLAVAWSMLAAIVQNCNSFLLNITIENSSFSSTIANYLQYFAKWSKYFARWPKCWWDDQVVDMKNIIVHESMTSSAGDHVNVNFLFFISTFLICWFVFSTSHSRQSSNLCKIAYFLLFVPSEHF